MTWTEELLNGRWPNGSGRLVVIGLPMLFAALEDACTQPTRRTHRKVRRKLSSRETLIRISCESRGQLTADVENPPCIRDMKSRATFPIHSLCCLKVRDRKHFEGIRNDEVERNPPGVVSVFPDDNEGCGSRNRCEAADRGSSGVAASGVSQQICGMVGSTDSPGRCSEMAGKHIRRLKARNAEGGAVETLLDAGQN